MSDALPAALEQPKDRITCTRDRTLHRIMSPRSAASGSPNKVGKGKKMALRIGSRGPSRFELLGHCLTLSGGEWIHVWWQLIDRNALTSLPCAINNQLRTGAGTVH